MYYFKANDKNGTEYGPLDAEQIREWVREKRMDDHSLVRKSPDEEWRPLGQVPDWQASATPAVTLPEGMPPAARSGPPGKLQAIAIMTLVGGIIGVLVGLLYGCYFGVLTIATFGFGVVFMLFPIYSLIFGIMAVTKGSQMLGSNPLPAFRSAKSIAIMQIINIICCDL
ncbi:MAG: GYF domain-containing protein, partial [Verrucomicrobiota bacterium]|nr:GYF domain-containing protein [Verrucomicrobiota bacterium]